MSIMLWVYCEFVNLSHCECISTTLCYCAGLMRKEHPGVALSVKTFQAVRSVLNHCHDTIKQLQGSGVLDEQDAEKLIQVLSRLSVLIWCKCEIG